MNSEFKRVRTENFGAVVLLCQDSGQSKDTHKGITITI
jgi:hypothetical protein